MERVQVLIDKLVQQSRAGENPAQLLYTVQLLQTELVQMQQQQQARSSKKVAVVMPANYAMQHTQVIVATPSPATTGQKEKETFSAPVQKEVETPVIPQPEPSEVKAPLPAMDPAIPTPAAEAEKPKAVPQQKDLFGTEAYSLKRPTVLQEEKKEEPQPVIIKEEPATPMPAAPAEPQPFDVLAETPTLLQHIPPQVETPKELNQMISAQQPSLNDRLKQDKVELAHKLKDSPIKDLRKAIGINDRFLFVNELFRGDEVMYERSIKTINSFHILPEAEYWMNRELKVKLGWNDTKDTVQHFYNLVRRRFS